MNNLSIKTVGIPNRKIPTSLLHHQISYMAIPDIKIQSETNYLTVHDAITIVLSNTTPPIITKEHLMSKTRKREIVTARQTIFYLLRKYSKHSLTYIAKQFNKDHATVLHSQRTIENLCFSSFKFKSEILQFEEKVKQIINR